MNLCGSPDRFLAISDTADRRSYSEELIADIASALTVAGQYVVLLDLQPTQRIVDLNWAARQAGRRLGKRVHVTSRIIKAAAEMEVRVTALAPLK